MKTRKINTLVCLACLACILFTACLKSKEDVGTPEPPVTPPPAYKYDWLLIADSSQSSLNSFYNAGAKYYTASNTSNEWTFYWPSAHALDVLADLYLRKPSEAVKTRMSDLLDGVKSKNGNTFINYYYDDMEWMALACLRAYNATSDIKYKEVVDQLWTDIRGGWSTDLGGGLWWRKDNSSKNTPSNMPAAILAARLYKKFNDPDDLVWAKNLYEWQKSVLYDAANGLVYDNISKDGNKNTSWKFTYNQGTFLGAALELYSITKNSDYLNDALKAADYTLNSGQLTDIANGILKDEGGGDGGLFKGVFVRYFTRLVVDGGLSPDKKTAYLNFLKKNAEKLWSAGTNKSLVLFGSAWNTPPGNSTDFTVQLSGMMLFEAMAELKKLSLTD